MATLTNTKIKDTYVGLLKTTDNQAIDASGVTLVEDGSGNASALSVGRANNGATITGSLNATLATAAQPNITSVGTLSSLDISGNLAVDTNTLYVDASGNSVGIGTSSPASPNAFATNLTIAGSSASIVLDDTDASAFEIASLTDSLRIYNETSELWRIDSSGNVGIGTSAARSILETNGTISINDSTNGLVVGNTLAGLEIYTSDVSYNPPSGRANMPINRILPVCEHANGDAFGMAFYTADQDADSVERMRILSSGGITFNGDTAAANALDDYEEGTFTPVYEPQTGSFATMTMDVLDATYTKIGRLVHINVNLRTDDVDVTGASGNVFIGGLPFTARDSSGNGGGISVGYTAAFVDPPTAGGFVNNGTSILLRKGTSPLTISDLTDGTTADRNTLYLSATYITS